jgi:hypothetical protein
MIKRLFYYTVLTNKRQVLFNKKTRKTQAGEGTPTLRATKTKPCPPQFLQF